jgi:hypothetical protein
MRFILYLLLLLSATCYTQELKTIFAGKEMVDVRQGKKLKKKAWKISPDVSPDVFSTNSNEVTFYTDKDQITVYPYEGKPVDFIINLNGSTALTRVEYNLTYLQKLQRGAIYNTGDNRDIPDFIYAAPTDENLSRLKRDFKLDSIAGSGSEVSKIKNIMKWVHNTIRHDGMSDNPQEQNAFGIINACRNGNRGVNCRMMATVLNECYLAMGFKSRFITCMPKELEFNDCHVINAVYSNDLNKWLWMDATFEAYVMDNKGNLLSVEEVRERLITGQPLKLNKEANWNHKEKKTKENYLNFYMAKNLYRIQTPALNTFNTETPNPGAPLAYIELVPLDGLNQQHKQELVTNGGDKRTFYVTNNPILFWAEPR